jgi:hypothetical protein
MHNKANFRVVLTTTEFVLIEDVGPHDMWLTVTNAVEGVVRELVSTGKAQSGQRLFYIDSMNDMDEIEFDVMDGFQRFRKRSETDEVANICMGAWDQLNKYKK